MDGKTLRNQLAYLIRESTTSSFLDEKTSYDFLYEAAVEFCRITQALHGIQTITTTADTTGYVLNPDFLSLQVMDSFNTWAVKFYDGTSTSFISFRPYEAIYYANNTTAAGVPNNFSITDVITQTANITGLAAATGSASETQPQLTGTAEAFANASVGDSIHNTSDGSDGIIISKTSNTILLTNLFYGSLNYWTSGDAYVIVPQGRKQLVVDPPSSVAGYTITVPYVQKPSPVYSEYGTYRFDPIYAPSLVKYAAWLYKYRDREPNYGDAFFTYFTAQVRRAAKDINKAYDRSKFRVNLTKRSLGDRSYR